MEITFYGVRGSVPVPGPGTNEYGGNTPCIHVKSKKGYDIVLDSGTGICNLARKFMATPLGKGQGEVAMLLSHTHLDHIQGFPFFIPAFVPGNKIKIFGGHPPKADLKTVLDGQLNASYSPIFALSNFAASLMIQEVTDEPFELDGVKISSDVMPHTTMASVAYRLDEEGKSFVYMTDIEHYNGDLSDNALALAEDADILVHDTHFSPEDYTKGRGHSSLDMAVELARKARVKQLVMFHYSPDYADDAIRKLYDRFKDQSDLTLIAAREELKLVL